jgi:hypothetical protein
MIIILKNKQKKIKIKFSKFKKISIKNVSFISLIAPPNKKSCHNQIERWFN